KGSRKQVKRGQKEYERLADHIGLLPAVMISPYDMNLVTGFSEDRRRFMDGVIAQYDRAYLESLLNYNRLLSQRNALLKHMAIEGIRKSETLDILSMQMEGPAQHIYETRKAFLERLTAVFQDYYERLSGGKEQVSLTYQSHLHEKSQKEWLLEHTSRDLVLQHTGRGVHKDDLVFQLGEYAVKRMGSQGQQKTYLIALKLSQYALMAEIKKVKPILMIDDVFDKLDEHRVASLMKLIATEAFGQVFITDAHTGRLPAIFTQPGVDAEIYEVNEGAVKKPLTAES
ncbi:MAG: DNA replication and repair protein RecF, partial [Flavobacteriales bacterium]|nr:DNA replication and repair protein RecF [Flavobacteriales bacterium]